MREWMREKMKRRSKRGPNNSESTGKIGQELPQNQVAPPLRPSYSDAPSAAPLHDDEISGEQKLEHETQPENVGAPPPEASAQAAGSAKTSRGFVVLAIGLPGSGK